MSDFYNFGEISTIIKILDMFFKPSWKATSQIRPKMDFLTQISIYTHLQINVSATDSLIFLNKNGFISYLKNFWMKI